MVRVLPVAVLVCLACVASGATSDYSGFWKNKCEDAFGLQIKPAGSSLYSISFCGPGGCFEPGTYRPNTRIEGDPLYEIVSITEIRVKLRDGSLSKYLKCSNEPTPVLRY